MRHHGACGFCIGRLRRDSAWTRRLLSSFCANLMLLLKLLPIVFAPSRRTPPRRLRRHGTLVVCVCVVCAISAHSSSDVASSAPLRHHGALLRVVCAITAQVSSAFVVCAVTAHCPIAALTQTSPNCFCAITAHHWLCAITAH